MPLEAGNLSCIRRCGSNPHQADTDVADLDQCQRPENDDASIIEPIVLATSAA